jgi:hypothetical protein
VLSIGLSARLPLSGDKVCDAFHVKAEDDRMMIPTLVNMLVWNFVVVVAVVSLY